MNEHVDHTLEKPAVEETAETVEATDAAAEAAKPKPELGEIIHGLTKTIEEGIRQLGTRLNVVNVRVDDASLAAIDTLVSAGIFKTRSETAAYLIQVGIESKSEVFTQLDDTARRITELREQMKDALGRRTQSPVSVVPSDTEEIH